MSTAEERAQARSLRRLACLQAVSMGAMEMSGPFWPWHLQRLGGLSDTGLAWASALVYAGPMALAMLSMPWWGRMGDRIGHKPMVLRALLALALTQAVVAWTSQVTVVIAARLLQGVLGGFIAAAQAYGAGLVMREQRGVLMARLQVATAVGSALGPAVGGLLYDRWGFAGVSALAAALCLACAALALLALPGDRRATMARRGASPVGRTPAVWRGEAIVLGLLLGIVLVQAGKMMPQAFFALYAQRVLHADGLWTGLFYGATAVGLCLAAPWWARWSVGRSRSAILTQVQWLCGASAVCVGWQALLVHPYWFLLARLVWGVCLAALLPVLLALLSREVSDRHQGRVLGAGNSAAKAGALLGTGAGALVMLWLPERWWLAAVAAVYGLAACGLHGIRRRQRSFVRHAPGTC